ncbi:TetR family transcriptional regulator C-terminal domain-containing protein [Levilactobacillus brevis]|uniref:TetR/AcrR family transcriptional regulator n=1 Tax=Levilactobacillus brevis TaxID=1580 RepID=UPI001BA49699|nr:TetR-like C-terminal domain-containing protein [Levilactobacillus brevis]MBS1005522.1 TetR family transcriptional regulator C-terminal domain-containing protein [Levilactobacillus brevis]
MYHVKLDKRSQASARLILAGLYTCLEAKPFAKITVADIQRASSVGRATFYRLFDNLSDVLSYECSLILQEFLQRPQPDNTSERFAAFFKDWMTHDVLLAALMTSGNRDLLYVAFRAHALELRQLLSPQADLTSDETDFFIYIATSAVIGALAMWLQHDRQETPEQLTAMMVKTLTTVTVTFNH